MKIPYIPEDAPFNTDQRAWLGGFLAGLHSRLAIAADASVATGSAAGAKTEPLFILYGTQTGNAERVAMDAAATAQAMGLTAEVAGLDDIGMERLATMRRLIVVTSTYGEGEMPDNAQLFWDALSASTAPRLEDLRFAVLALGDTGYDGFCQAGKLIDMRLEQLGASRILPRRDCDIDYEDPANAWIPEALPLTAPDDGAGGTRGAVAGFFAQPARQPAGAARIPMPPGLPSIAVCPEAPRQRKSATMNSILATAACNTKPATRWASCRSTIPPLSDCC